jgi:chemotaxis protein CheC
MHVVPASSSSPSPPERAALAVAAANAAQALSEMSGRTIGASFTRLSHVPVAQLALIGGDPEQQIVGVYLGVEGDTTSHVLLGLSEATAFRLADLLLGASGARNELDAMAVSALAEIGNVVGTCFLNVLADGARLTLAPTLPVVLREMRGAILDSLGFGLVDLEEASLTVVETSFTCDGEAIDVAVFLLGSSTLSQLVSLASSRKRA